jgi:acetyl-CoA acetyltransferase
MEITIEQRWELLKLQALEWAGVDNWDGYDYAIDTYHELLEKEGLDEDED